MKRKSLIDLKQMKESGTKIVSLTAYDYLGAQAIEQAGLDFILVGDSLGMVVLGYESTLPVTIDEMIHHAKAVVRGAPYTMVVVDMPFMSYQQSPREALRHAGRIIKETGAHAVKLEGGLEMVDTVKQLVSMGIPVMGHLGLLPQSVNQQGGYKVQGKKGEDEERLQKDIRVLEEAGCFAVVLECIPRLLAKNLTARVSIPTIGIGAGVDCDGQILVWHDLLGLTEGPSPKFLKRYVNLSLGIREALRAYQKEVVSVEFPSLEYSY